MAIDPSIILGVKPPQFDNPLDIARQAQSLQALGYQNQNAQREMQTQQDLRSAYSQAMTAGPDGMPTIDRQKVYQGLQNNPMALMGEQQKFQAQDAAKSKMDLERLKDQHEQAANLLSSIPRGPGVDPVAQQTAWEKANAQAQQLGFPGAQNAPKQYPGDSYIENALVQTMGAKDQMDRQLKMSEFAQREKDRQLQRDQMGMGKQSQALQQTQSMMQSARGNPEVSQALKDRLAANKFEGLVNLYGDPNKLNPAQVQMAAMEVAKIASGGVPTHAELEGLQPSTIPQGFAKLAEYVSNNPQSSQAGEFVKRMQDYVGSLKKDANNAIRDNYTRILEPRRGQLGEQHYNDLKAQYLDPLMSQTAHPQDDAAMSWAKQNPTDPRAARILQLNGGSK